jgi:two-component system, cell cycle response regulator
MSSLFVARPRSGPDPAELVPLSERAMYLELVRIGFSSVVIAWAALAPTIAISRVVLAASALAYVAVAAVPQMLRRLGKHRVLPLLQLMLLLDGLYLAYVMDATGGAASPLRLLVYAHIVAVTLLTSYRTAMKIALWHTLLFLVLLEAGTGSSALGGFLASTNVSDP